MGEVASYQEFLERHRRRIIVTASKALWVMECTDPESHSEDVAGDVARRVTAHWHGLRSPEYALYRIIANAARDHIKVCLAQVPQEIPDTATPCFVQAGQDPEEMLADALLIKELLALLNPTERDVIQLWFCGYSFEEIGKSMDMPSGTVRAIKWRAIEKMRRIAVTLRDGESAT